MLIYIVIMMGLLALVVLSITMLYPYDAQENFNHTINTKILPTVIEYTLDKNYYDDSEEIKEGYYSLAYYMDSDLDEYNDTFELEYQGKGPITVDELEAFAGASGEEGYVGDIINGEANEHNFGIKVTEETQNVWKIEAIRFTIDKHGDVIESVIYTFFK